MTVYVCHFKIGDRTAATTIPDIGTAKDGFWVDQDYEYTFSSDATYWIPPSSILYVRKHND